MPAQSALLEIPGRTFILQMKMTRAIQTQCCIAGGGPAGMMLGFLLARAGVDVCVLEKHGDFLRDFRGDTIHPSTLELMYELGLLDEFLKRPHQELRQIAAQIGNEMIVLGDLTHVPTHCKFLALMPQWDFLNFLVEHARDFPTFHLKMNAEVTEVVEENGRIVGVRAKTAEGPQDVAASLTVGADGRHSTVRKQAGLEVIEIGSPMDVLWMRLSRKPGDPGQSFGHADAGKMLVLIGRGEYWQCAFVIPKGSADELRQRGIAAFREDIARLTPFLRDRVDELHDWNDVSLLTVKVDRLARWYKPGLLCIGDAAHAMSPIGGVGINLAIQDAVATANILAEKLRREIPSESDLEKVQQRRMFPTRATQWVQTAVQNRIIKRVLDESSRPSFPWPFKLLKDWPYLQRIPARIIGVGFRPEHVRTQARYQNLPRAA